MFLKSITINNYKSIQKATVGFENGLNIIIGKNGSGKSNLLEFIYQGIFYHTITGKLAANINLEYEFAICYDYESALNELIIHIKRERNISSGEIEYLTEVRYSKIKDGVLLYEDRTIFLKDKEVNGISNNELYNFFKETDLILNFNRTFVSFETPKESYWLAQPSKFEIDTQLIAIFGRYADDLDIIFKLNKMIDIEFGTQKSLKFSDITLDNVQEILSKIFDDFNKKYQINHNLSKFSPIQDIRINPNINIYKVDNKILVENLLIDFKVNDSWVPWSYLSDGSKRLFYLITQCLSLKDGLLLVEEPELGIHPHQLYALMNFLKEQSYDKQIIISTHSPIVLDILKPDELSKITIAKIEKNGSQFYKLTSEQIALAKEYMQDVADLSDYWLHSDLENNYAETND